MKKNKKNRISRKLQLMGLHLNYKVFGYMRIVSTIILFIGLLFLSPYGYIVAPICALIYYFLLEYIILDLGIKRRKRLLESQANSFFRTFLLLLKSGRGIKNSLILTTSVLDNELSYEFRKELGNIKNGKTIEEGLSSLTLRIPSLIINNIITSVIEASRYGNNVLESILLQLEYIKEIEEKRVLRSYRVVPYKAALLSLMFGFIMIGILILFAIYV